MMAQERVYGLGRKSILGKLGARVGRSGGLYGATVKRAAETLEK